ncbi:MAG: topoisomerase IV, partial [Clostridia bacterium]|nr:topoisomerase IV [Clostridia bacterium]
RNTEEESEVIPNLMIGFKIDKIQAEYVAEIKLRHLNKEYILKRLQDISNLEIAIKDLQETLDNPKKIKQIIAFELKEVIKKYAKPRKTEIVYSTDIEEDEEQEESVPDYPVTLFFTKEGYFKKITPQSLRMSNVQKLKEGDEILLTVESSNNKELLFFTNKCQVYKSRVSDFADTKASVFGDYVAAKLEMEQDETAVYMAVTDSYKGFMMFFFENGKAAKVEMSAYATKTKRKKLIKAFSDKSPVVSFLYIEEDKEIVLKSSAGRLLLVNTAVILPKTTKDTIGVSVMTLKKGQKLFGVRDYIEGEFTKPYRYKSKNLPAAGALPSADDVGEQLTL